MAQIYFSSDANAAELRDSLADHKKYSRYHAKHFRSEFEANKVDSQPNEELIQIQEEPKLYSEWLRELVQPDNLVLMEVYKLEQTWRKEQNLEVEKYITWVRNYLIGMAKLKKELENEEVNHQVLPSLHQQQVKKDRTWYKLKPRTGAKSKSQVDIGSLSEK